jgi:hypothetical protein
MVVIVRRGPVGDNFEGGGESPLSHARARTKQVILQHIRYKLKLPIIFEMIPTNYIVPILPRAVGIYPAHQDISCFMEPRGLSPSLQKPPLDPILSQLNAVQNLFPSDRPHAPKSKCLSRMRFSNQNVA